VSIQKHGRRPRDAVGLGHTPARKPDASIARRDVARRRGARPGHRGRRGAPQCARTPQKEKCGTLPLVSRTSRPEWRQRVAETLDVRGMFHTVRQTIEGVHLHTNLAAYHPRCRPPGCSIARGRGRPARTSWRGLEGSRHRRQPCRRSRSSVHWPARSPAVVDLASEDAGTDR
jgi:hypothetical protein